MRIGLEEVKKRERGGGREEVNGK
jgi:hypothetical protein